MTKNDFVQYHDRKRKENKDKWFCMLALVEGVSVSIKSYNTWVQILEFNGIRYSGPMDCKVAEYRDFLRKSLEDL